MMMHLHKLLLLTMMLCVEQTGAQPHVSDDELLLLSCRELCANIRQGNLTSSRVIESLHHRHQKWHPEINGLAISLFDEAFATAKHLDSLAALNIIAGPLHGMPITIKENIDIQGIATNLGIHDPRIQPAKEDADIVKILKSLGAIIIGKSNVPQALIPMDCNNSEYGQTYNPWNREFVTGGSSGGEGALIASGQSFIGIGTDLGGSIRFPAGFCGIAGFKPTTGSLPRFGIHSALTGQNSVLSEAGPMARNTDDLIFLLEHVFNAISDQKSNSNNNTLMNDVSAPAIKLNSAEMPDVSKMRIGYFKDDGFITPAPALVKAVEESIDILKDAGADIVEIPCNYQQELIKHYIAILSADGQKTLKQRFTYQKKPVPQMKNIWRLSNTPRFILRIAAWYLKLKGDHRLAGFLLVLKEKSVDELWRINAEIQSYRMEEMRLWQEMKLDAVVCPASALTGVQRGMEGNASLIFSYYGRYNLFGFPAGVVPIRFVGDDELEYEDPHNDMLSKLMAKSTKASRRMPAAVQVVALPWQDQKALAVMKMLEEKRMTEFKYPNLSNN